MFNIMTKKIFCDFDDFKKGQEIKAEAQKIKNKR